MIARELLLVPPVGHPVREDAMDGVLDPLPPVQDREGAKAGNWGKSMREDIHRLRGDPGGVESPKRGTPRDGLWREEVDHCGDMIRDATM